MAVRHNPRPASGFTLIELITVIVVLGIVSVGIAGFLGSGAQIFVDATERDQLVSESRFVVERLNREVRTALPNSLRVATSDATHCAEFVPVIWSSYYFDLPVTPDTDSQLEVVAWSDADEVSIDADHYAVVYALTADEIYDIANSGHIHLVSSADAPLDEKLVLRFGGSAGFDASSPSSRLFLVQSPVSYCAHSDGRITRHQDYGFFASQALTTGSLGSGVLMGQNLENCLAASCDDSAFPFRYQPATLVRSSALLTNLEFALNDETIAFTHEVHQTNVP